jgi:hypothetical protein
MADTDSNPEDEYAEDREQPEVSLEIPFDEPEEDVIEQRQEVPLYQDEDQPWWDEAADEEQEDEDEDQ